MEGPDNQADARTYATSLLKNRMPPALLDSGVDTLLHCSKGLFVYLAAVSGRLTSFIDDAKQLKQLPNTLDGLYRKFYEMQRAPGEGPSGWAAALAAVFCRTADTMATAQEVSSSSLLHALVAFQEPPSIDMLCWALGGADAPQVEARLLELASFFRLQTVNGQLSAVAVHKSVLDFLTDKQRSKDLYVDAPEAHRRLAACCLAEVRRRREGRWQYVHEAVGAYVGRHALAHARSAGSRALLRELCPIWQHISTVPVPTTADPAARTVIALGFSRDGDELASITPDAVLRQFRPNHPWYVSTTLEPRPYPKETHLKTDDLPTNYRIRCAAIGHGSAAVAYASGNCVRLRAGPTIQLATGAAIAALAVSSDGQTVAAGLEQAGIQLVSVATGGRKDVPLGGHEQTCLSVSPDGSILAVGLRSGSLLLCNTVTFETKSAGLPDQGAVRCMAFSPNGQLLAYVTESAAIKLLDVGSAWQRGDGQVLASQNVAAAPTALAWSAAGALACALPDGSSELWDVLRGLDDRQQLHLAAHTGDADGCKRLVQAGADVNVATSYGWRPLHFAASRGQTDVCTSLLNLGANRACEGIGGTAYNVAAANDHKSAADAVFFSTNYLEQVRC